jgi:glutathione S-transferase
MIVIYGSSMSPFLRKAMVFAIEKGIPFDPQPGGNPASGYLVEDRFTLADIAVASPFATMALGGCPVDARTHPKTKAYLEGVLARPSFAELLEKEKAVLAA